MVFYAFLVYLTPGDGLFRHVVRKYLKELRGQRILCFPEKPNKILHIKNIGIKIHFKILKF